MFWFLSETPISLHTALHRVAEIENVIPMPVKEVPKKVEPIVREVIVPKIAREWDRGKKRKLIYNLLKVE